MLWICIQLPALPVEVFAVADQQPLVVADKNNGKAVIAFANQSALAVGLKVGTGIKTAMSLQADLLVKERNPVQEQQALQQVATLAYRFASQVAICPPDQVLLEVAPSLKLFNGWQGLQQQFCQALADLAYSAYGVAHPAPAAAALLARAWPQPRAQLWRPPPEQLPLSPVAAMPLGDDMVARLQALGLEHLQQLLALPRDSLGTRFGQALLTYLDQLQGRRYLPLQAFQLAPEFDQCLDFCTEQGQIEALLFAVNRLLRELCVYLQARQLSVTRLHLELGFAEQSHWFDIKLSLPCKEHPSLCRLLRYRLERVQLPQPVRKLRLQARDFAAWQAVSGDLLSLPGDTQTERDQLLASLQARLGENAVRGFCLKADYRPECSWQLAEPGQSSAVGYYPAGRPLWLLEKPQSLASTQGFPQFASPLKQLQGPERIAGGWWDQQSMQRDYYQALLANGQRLWLFQDEQLHWFVQGYWG